MRKIIFGLILSIVAIVTGIFFYSPEKTNYNLLLISIDTLRADHLGAYGYKLASTKNIDSLAKEGVLFENCFAQAPLTLPSHASIMSGTNPTTHGIKDNLHNVFPDKIPTIATILKSYHYQTTAVVSAAPLNQSNGLGKGFDEYSDVSNISSDDESKFVTERVGEKSVEIANTYLQKMVSKKRPFFMWLHLFDAHAEYKAPERFAESFTHPYDAEIAYIDYCLGLVFSQLKKLKQYKNTIIVLVADHGEGLGEHGELSHGYFLYNTTTHVPLIIKSPGMKAGKKISSPVRTIDILPTVMALMDTEDLRHNIDKEEKAWSEGVNLAPAMQNDNLLLPCYSETYYPYHAFGWSTVASLIEGDYKYIHTKKGEFYNIKKDPKEKQNLLQKNNAKYLALAQEKRTLLLDIQKRQISAKYTSSDPNESATMASGYFHRNQPKKAPTAGPDPVDMVNVLKLITNAQTQMFLRQYIACEKTLQLVVEKDPKNITAWILMGKLYTQMGMSEKSIIAFDELEKLCISSKFARNGKIDALIELGKLGKAMELIDKIYAKYDNNKNQDENVAKKDPFLLTRRAYIFLEKGNYAKAEKEANLATILDSKLPSAPFYLGRALQFQKKYNRASKAYAKAVQLKEKYPQAYYFWAECLFDMKKMQQCKIRLKIASEQSSSLLLQKKIKTLLLKIKNK